MAGDVDILSNTKSEFWKFSAPLIMLSIFQALYSFVDMFWASQLTSEAFFAIGVTAPLVSLITCFGDSIGIGTNSVISRELGKRDYENTYNSILHGILLCAIISAFFMMSAYFLKDILILMNVKTSINLAIDYITPIFMFSSVIIFSSLFVNTLQAEGNSRTPAILLFLSNIINLILDPILMFVLGFGVKGAAYSSIISSAVVLAYLLYLYLARKTYVVLSFKHFRAGIVYDIFIVAVPNFIVKGLWCLAMMYVNGILINQLGELGVLLYSAATQMESLILSPVKAFGKALVSMSGYIFGAGRLDSLKEIYDYVLRISVLFVIFCGVAFFFVRDYGFAIFSITDAETYIFYIAVFGIAIMAGEAISSISTKILDGMGKSYHSLILESGTIIFEIIVITLLAPVFASGACVLIGIFLSELLFALLYYIVLRNIFNGKNMIEEMIDKKLDR